MKKLIILTLSLLSASCAQASEKPDQQFSPEYSARKHDKAIRFFNWFKKDPNLQVKVEESAEDMKREVIRLRKYGEACYSEAEQSCQALLIYQYTKRCSKKYSNPNDAKQCSASAIRVIAIRMKQNGFKTHGCDRALDKLNRQIKQTNSTDQLNE